MDKFGLPDDGKGTERQLFPGEPNFPGFLNKSVKKLHVPFHPSSNK
jgi:hypothetical protein